MHNEKNDQYYIEKIKADIELAVDESKRCGKEKNRFNAELYSEY